MVAFEVSIAIRNHIADRRLALLNNCGYSPHLEKPRSCAGPRVPAGPLTLIADEGAWAVI
jgi:hypothetical protein